MSEPEVREVAPPPPADRRTWIVAACFVWLALQIAIPLRYYLGDDVYDERFAWRMFSAVRVQRCSVGVTETRGGRAQPLQLMSVLPAPWASLMERNRPAVIERFLHWRCDGEDAPESIVFQNRCATAAGERLPVVEYTIDCERGVITRPEAPAPDEGDDGASTATEEGE